VKLKRKTPAGLAAKRRDAPGELVCLTVYRRGAREVVRRLRLATA
jgi:hypothetical protein